MKVFLITLSIMCTANNITCYNEADYKNVQEQIKNREPVVCKNGDLSGADLSNLTCDELLWSDFEGTNLTRANFSNSEFTFANFKGAYCAGAIFCNSTLLFCKTNNKTYFCFADFTGAKIINCDFAYAKLEGAIRFVPLEKIHCNDIIGADDNIDF